MRRSQGMRERRGRRTVTIATWGLALLLAAGGCANLDAVRAFAKASAATAASPQVVSDYERQPERLKRLEPPDAAAGRDASIKQRKAQADQLAVVQAVLIGYLTSLGDLAGDGLANVSAPVDGFVGQLKEQGLIGDRAATAAASIAEVLIRAGLEGWRRKRTAVLIRVADPHMQKVLAGLSDIVSKDFMGSLDVEEEAVRKRFNGWEAAVRRHDPDGAPPVVRLLMEEHLDAVAQRRHAASAYARALQKIGEGHAELAKNVDHLDKDVLKKQLISTVGDLRMLYNALIRSNSES